MVSVVAPSSNSLLVVLVYISDLFHSRWMSIQATLRRVAVSIGMLVCLIGDVLMHLFILCHIVSVCGQ